MKDSSSSEINTGLKLLAKSSMIVLIGIFLSKLFTYLYRIVVARYFGPEVYGVFSLALIILGFFTAFSSLGLTDGLARFFSFYRGRKQFDRIRYLFKRVTIILIISGLFSAILLFLLSDFISINIFHSESIADFLKVFSILIPLTILTNVFLNIIRAFEKIGWYSSIWNILQNLVKLLTLVVLIFLGAKENAVIFSYSLGILSMLIVAYFVCRYSIKEIFGLYELKREDKSKMIKEVFSYSWPIMLSGLMGSIFYWTDSTLIGYFMKPSDVGIYNAATPIVGLMAIVPIMFSQLFFPLITRHFSQKKYSVIKELSKQVGKWVFILDLPIFILMFLFPGAIINIFFGKEYILAQNVLRILSIGGIFSSFTFLLTDLISAVGKSRLIFYNIFITSLINILLDILLIKKYGIEGAAIATTIVWVILSITLLIEVRYYVHFIPLRKKMIIILLASLIPLSLLLILKKFIEINTVSIILLGILFILFYLLLIFLTKCLDRNDMLIIKGIIEKIKNNIDD